MPFIKIVKVSREKNIEEVKKHEIQGYPTIYIYKDGEFKNEILGALNFEAFEEYFKKYLY